jgi:uncharacterized protein (TIGR03437 family)
MPRPENWGITMKKLSISALLLVISNTLPAQNLRIVNAASLSSVSVAPGSIISIFGTKLSSGVAVADSAQNPPATLGGVTVTIGSSPAALFYVSPTQINAVVNQSAPTGTQTVTVTSGGGSQTGSITIDTKAPPGLFSLFGTGTRDGAIQNAITFLLGDFSTHVANSPTFLALYATGLETTTPVVTIGGIQVTVTYAGPAPCCAGLDQINVQLPDSLAGAGRVPVVVSANGQTSNTVQVVLLPPQTAKQFPGDMDNQARSRELAALAYIPGTSLVLSTDQNDDVVRVIDVAARQVKKIVSLAQGAGPVGIAVDGTGNAAVVAESDRQSAAVINLTTGQVTELHTGLGPVAVAIDNTTGKAIVVNGDEDTVSTIDLTSSPVAKTLSVGRGPRGVAADSGMAYVTNEDDGTVSVIDLTALSMKATISLGATVRPEAIAVIGAGPNGQVLQLDLSSGKTTSLAINPDRSGGTSDLAYFKPNLYFANQAGGSVSVLPVDSATGVPSGNITSINVDLGPRALAIDTNDKLLVVSNEGSGTLVLVDLTSNKVVGSIKAVQTGLPGDDGDDDHSDRGAAVNRPVITSISPASAKAGSASFTITINGTNLAGATGLEFVNAADMPSNGHGQGKGLANNVSADPGFTVTGISVDAAGKQLTATVQVLSSAAVGPHLVRVLTPNGESMDAISAANTFTVLQQ